MTSVQDRAYSLKQPELEVSRLATRNLSIKWEVMKIGNDATACIVTQMYFVHYKIYSFASLHHVTDLEITTYSTYYLKFFKIHYKSPFK